MPVTKAPGMFMYRSGIAAADSTPPTDQKQGLNTADYKRLNVHVIAGATAAPVLAVYVWSDAAGAFVKKLPVLGIAAQAVGVDWSTTIDCDGEILWLQVTGSGIDVSNTVSLEVSAYGLDSTL